MIGRTPMFGSCGELDGRGYVVVERLFDTAAVGALIGCAQRCLDTTAARRGGVRHVMAQDPELARLVHDDPMRSLVAGLLSDRAVAIGCTVFDKSSRSNWLVPWHQDRAIAVNRRADVAGFGPWSIKGGVHHVEPPADVLDRILIVRVHLDRCDGENGALRVLPGSHRRGVVSRRPAVDPVDCPVGRGGALVMRPLLWHASPKADQPSHRRVVHVGFAGFELPDPLDWYERYPLDVSN